MTTFTAASVSNFVMPAAGNANFIRLVFQASDNDQPFGFLGKPGLPQDYVPQGLIIDTRGISTALEVQVTIGGVLPFEITAPAGTYASYIVPAFANPVITVAGLQGADELVLYTVNFPLFPQQYGNPNLSINLSSFYLGTIAALRALNNSTTNSTVTVSGYAAPADGGGGIFVVNAADTTSADNGGTIIVDSVGRRWYRLTSGTTYSVLWFGAKGDGTTDDTTSIYAAFTAAAGRVLAFPPGTYYCATGGTAAANSRGYVEIGATFTGQQPGGVDWQYEQAEPTATAGSTMAIEHLCEKSTVLAATEGGLWPGTAFAYYGTSYEFTSSVGQAGSPVIVGLDHAVANGSPGDVVARLSLARAYANGASVFGNNTIANADGSPTNVKLVGMEIDIEPSSTATVASGSGGLFLNAFNLTNLGPAIQTGNVGGGGFTNGIIIDGVSGAGLAAGSAIMTSLIDTSNGSYTGAAIKLGVTQTQTFYNGTTGAGVLFSDTGSNFNISVGATCFVRGPSSTEGVSILSVNDVTGVQPLVVYVARGNPANSAACALKVNGQSVTSRSINAGGTINASGADYAEYETKRDDCATIGKGQIVGFDADGLLTDKWANAVLFGVKSTAPNLVGGDVWFSETPPEAPLAPVSPGDRPQPQEQYTRLAPKYATQIALEHNKRVKEWETKQAAFEIANVQYNNAVAKYTSDLAAFTERLEAARAKVDRIAYCGKCPINVFGAKVGQWVIPVAEGEAIGAKLVDAPSLDEYLISVGRVRRLLSDGRAEIVVKPI